MNNVFNFLLVSIAHNQPGDKAGMTLTGCCPFIPQELRRDSLCRVRK